jgi:AcrR family transcriptional regulator
MATRPRSQRGEGERLRTALLDAATELLAESHDVDSLSVRAVTARAGVSPTALYLHFADKQALTRAVKERCYDVLGGALRAAQAEHEGDPRAELCAMGRAYLRFAREQPGQYAILFETHVPKGGLPPITPGDPGHAVLDLVLGIVSRLVEDETAAFETGCLAWMALHGRASIRAAMPTFPFPDDERFVELLVDRCVGPE